MGLCDFQKPEESEQVFNSEKLHILKKVGQVFFFG